MTKRSSRRHTRFLMYNNNTFVVYCTDLIFRSRRISTDRPTEDAGEATFARRTADTCASISREPSAFERERSLATTHAVPSARYLPHSDNRDYRRRRPRTMVNWVVAVCWPHWSLRRRWGRRLATTRVVVRRVLSEYIRHKKNIALPHTHLRILVLLSPISVRRRRLATVFRFTSVARPRPVCRRRLPRAQSGFF